MCCSYNIRKNVIDLFPSVRKPVRIERNLSAPALISGRRDPVGLVFGVTAPRGEVVLNARIETACEKPLFRTGMERRRCVLPASDFIETVGEKEAVFISESVLFMAGIFDTYGHFVILTKNADPVVAPFHKRMPVLIGRENLGRWLGDPAYARHLPPQNVAVFLRSPYVQKSLLEISPSKKNISA